jgi:hypothetical protein
MKTKERVPMKSCRIIAFLLLVAATAGSALAAPTTLYSGQTGVIPFLSDDGTKTMYVNIIFAVYDTSTGEYQGAPGPQRYVYVYVVQSQETSQLAVDLFSVVAPLGSIAGIGTIDNGGVDAVASIGGTPAVNSSADYAFSIAGMSLDPGESSFRLVYTSDFEYRTDGQAIVKGGTELDNDGLPVPDGDDVPGDLQTTEVPEPMTAALLALGGLTILRNRIAAKRHQ